MRYNVMGDERWQNHMRYFLIMSSCDSECMNVFLRTLSKAYPNDTILLCCDGAAWHKSAKLDIPDNTRLFFIPPYTPEMNPIEQIWKEIRLRGFRNQVFPSLNKVVDRLSEAIRNLSAETIQSISGRQWIISCFD